MNVHDLMDSDPFARLLFNHDQGNAYVEPNECEIEALQAIADDAEYLLADLANEGNQFGHLGIPGRWTVSVDDDGDVEWQIDRNFRAIGVGNTAILHLGVGRVEHGKARDMRGNMRRVAAAYFATQADNDNSAADGGGEGA